MPGLEELTLLVDGHDSLLVGRIKWPTEFKQLTTYKHHLSQGTFIPQGAEFVGVDRMVERPGRTRIQTL